MGAPSKKAKRIRQSKEFDLTRLALELNPPKLGPSVYAWSLAAIRDARDQQMRGQFRLPARLAESMRTDDALFVARENRLAPQRSLEVALKPAEGARGEAIAREADALYGAKGIGLNPETVADIHGHLVDHGIAFAHCTPTVREDGSRVDVFVKAWPIEFVQWRPTDRQFVTQVENGVLEPIVHGDGRWIVFCKNEIEPFKHGTILPASLVWATHAFALRDWAKGSVSHGNAKAIGKLPAGVPLQNADGSLTKEAAAFLELLRGIASSDAPAGIAPAGSELNYLVNSSTAWQVFKELIDGREKAAARIYLGTDGTLGSQGGAPGIDIQALFGVAATIVEGDLEALERGWSTGLLQPWTAMNFGDSKLAPTREYKLPDPDAEALKASFATRSAAFFADLKAARDAGMIVTQDLVNQLAAGHGVFCPKLPGAADVAASVVPLFKNTK